MGKMRQFRRALRSSVGQQIAYQFRDGWGATIVPTLEGVIRATGVHDGEIFAAFGEDDVDADDRPIIAERLAAPLIIPAGRGGKATALISMRGLCLYDLEFQPFCFSTLLLSQTVTSLANDPEIGTIVLDIDSPGGVATGTPEAADAVFAARESTRVVALVNPLAASAAYWIASQASEIAAVPSADVGSIGVFMLHADCSGLMEASGIKPTFIFAGPHKVEGNAFEPLSDESREFFQSQVNKTYRNFLRAVARGRGVSAADVEADFGGGRTLMADDARRAGMIDRIATVDAAMARWGVSAATLEGRRRGEQIEPEMDAAEQPTGQPIKFEQRQDGDDTIVFAVDDWLERAEIATSMIGESDDALVSRDGDKIFIQVANGSAVYEITDETDDVIVADRLEGEWREMPDEAPPTEAKPNRRRRISRLAHA